MQYNRHWLRDFLFSGHNYREYRIVDLCIFLEDIVGLIGAGVVKL